MTRLILSLYELDIIRFLIAGIRLFQRKVEDKQASKHLYSIEVIKNIRPINKHTYNIDDSNAQRQAARIAHKAQHCLLPCKKISKLKKNTNKHIHVHSAGIQID